MKSSIRFLTPPPPSYLMQWTCNSLNLEQRPISFLGGRWLGLRKVRERVRKRALHVLDRERERDVRQCNSVYHMNCNKEQPRGETFPGQHASYDYGEGDFWLSLIWQLQKCPQTGVNQQSNRHCSVRNIAYIKCSYHLRQCQENGQGSLMQEQK